MVRLWPEEREELRDQYGEMLDRIAGGEVSPPAIAPGSRILRTTKGPDGDFLTEDLGIAVVRGLGDAYGYARRQWDCPHSGREVAWTDGSVRVRRDGEAAGGAAAAYVQLPGGDIATHIQILHEMQDPACPEPLSPNDAECGALKLAVEKALERAQRARPLTWDQLVVLSDSLWLIETCVCGFVQAQSQGRRWERDIERTLECIRELRMLGVAFQIHWVPGHTGVPGNVRADKLAYNAAGVWLLA